MFKIELNFYKETGKWYASCIVEFTKEEIISDTMPQLLIERQTALVKGWEKQGYYYVTAINAPGTPDDDFFCHRLYRPERFVANTDFNYADWQAKELSKYAYPGRMMGMIANTEQEIPIPGMTKREVFAKTAMQGIINSVFGSLPMYEFQLKDWQKKYGENTLVRTAIVKDSIEMADELLKQLES